MAGIKSSQADLHSTVTGQTQQQRRAAIFNAMSEQHQKSIKDIIAKVRKMRGSDPTASKL